LIDTHSHLLPGLDDGSPDMPSSLEMAREAAALGTSVVVCTPHLLEPGLTPLSLVRKVLEDMKECLQAESIPLRLLLGFEVDLHTAAAARVEELRSFAIEGTDLLLLEVPHHGWPSMMEELIFRLRSQGFRPILAHPERNSRIQKDPELLSRCLRSGAIAQATTASLTDRFGKETSRAFFRQLTRGEVTLLGSDAHYRRRDSWALAPTLHELEDRMDPAERQRLVQGNPSDLLSGGWPTPVNAFEPEGGWLRRVKELGR
jgi:protein-tyrosine phosphatase